MTFTDAELYSAEVSIELFEAISAAVSEVLKLHGNDPKNSFLLAAAINFFAGRMVETDPDFRKKLVIALIAELR